MKKRHSLTRRLIGTILLLELISAGVLIGATVIYEWRMHLASFDVMLRERADTLLGAVSDAEDPADSIMLDMTGLTLPATDVYRVEEEKGRILGQSNFSMHPATLMQLAKGPWSTRRND